MAILPMSVLIEGERKKEGAKSWYMRTAHACASCTGTGTPYTGGKVHTP